MRARVYRFARGTKIPGKSPVSWFPSFTTFRSWRVATWMIASAGVSPTVAWGMVGAGTPQGQVRSPAVRRERDQVGCLPDERDRPVLVWYTGPLFGRP
jgi:hypothetical protein